MAFFEKKTTGYGSRLSNSLRSVVRGLVLLIGGSFLLFWNEGNYVETEKALEEGEQSVVPIVDIGTIDPQLNSKFIHATGLADTKDSVRDELFGVQDLAIALDRKVEYFQWVEKTKKERKDKVGGSEEEITTYTYDQEWSSEIINSANFKDPAYQNKNFVLTTIENKQHTAEHVSFGAYHLPDFIVHAIGGNEPININLSTKEKQEWESNIAKNIPKAHSDSKAKDNSQANLLHIQSNVAYIGKSASNPEIGDVRVTLTKTKPSVISILAKVNGNTFEPYIAQNGVVISQVTKGVISADNMFKNAHANNETITWMFRLIGLLLVVVGFKTMFGFIEMLFKIVPFLSNIVGSGVGMIVTVVGIAWSLIIVAIAWLYYRPIIALCFILVVVGLIIFLKTRRKNAVEQFHDGNPDVIEMQPQ